VAENIGHVKSVGQMTGVDTDPLIGRALAATRVYSIAAYWVAGAVAVALSLCPKVGAAISAIPPGVLGGATVVLYGLVGVLGVRIWLTNRVDFSLPRNQMTAAIALIIGIADFTWQIGDLKFTGIALGSLAALAVYHGMGLLGAARDRLPQRTG
jgi:xanthine/uracil permease